MAEYFKNSTELKSWVKSGKFDAIVNFAAETHVDRSIYDSKNFIETNIVGTYNLLESARAYWNNLKQDFQTAIQEELEDVKTDTHKAIEQLQTNQSVGWQCSFRND